jgi:hypothetical protein
MVIVALFQKYPLDRYKKVSVEMGNIELRHNPQKQIMFLNQSNQELSQEK